MSSEIETFVFLDLETTGLPWQERNQTKIIELCVLAASRADILRDDAAPPVKKLSFLLNPAREIHPEVVRMTGLSQATLKDCPLFQDKYDSVKKFLKSLPQPVCLVAHNGYLFDYKILLAEVKDAKRRLPPNILCVDSLAAFRELDPSAPVHNNSAANITDVSLEDEWPELDVSAEDWQEIDEICERLSESDLSTDTESPHKIKILKVEVIRQADTSPVTPKSKRVSVTAEKKPYNLSALYERLVQKKPLNAHRAEADCLMLLECVMATKYDFLPWADRNCKLLSAIKPLARYKGRK